VQLVSVDNNILFPIIDLLLEFISVDFNKRPINSYLYDTEWPYYVLDALPMAVSISSLAFNAVLTRYLGCYRPIQYSFPRQIPTTYQGRETARSRRGPNDNEAGTHWRIERA
jgi:hypothetical protein